MLHVDYTKIGMYLGIVFRCKIKSLYLIGGQNYYELSYPMSERRCITQFSLYSRILIYMANPKLLLWLNLKTSFALFWFAYKTEEDFKRCKHTIFWLVYSKHNKTKKDPVLHIMC